MHRPEWIKWFPRLAVVPHTLASPAALATDDITGGSKCSGMLCIHSRGWGIEVVGKEGNGWAGGAGRWELGRVRKER